MCARASSGSWTAASGKGVFELRDSAESREIWDKQFQARYEVELNCPATAIPEKITVDLDGLKIGDSIHISAIPLPGGVEPTITDRDFTVATLQSPGGGVKNEDEDEGEAETDDGTEEDDSE